MHSYPSYPSESQLLAALERHDQLVLQCADGELFFEAFCQAYDNFYWAYALDGHEADAEGNAMLVRHQERIAPHQQVAESILSLSNQPNSKEAVSLLKQIALGIHRGEV